MDHEKYSVKYGYDYIDHRVIYCPVIVAESVKFSLYEKIKYFIEDYGLIVVAAIAECFLLYLDPSLIPQAITAFGLSFIYTFIMLRM